MVDCMYKLHSLLVNKVTGKDLHDLNDLQVMSDNSRPRIRTRRGDLLVSGILSVVLPKNITIEAVMGRKTLSITSLYQITQRMGITNNMMLCNEGA